MSWAIMTRAERRDAVAGAAAAGVSAAKIARQLGTAVTAITALAERAGITFQEQRANVLSQREAGPVEHEPGGQATAQHLGRDGRERPATESRSETITGQSPASHAARAGTGEGSRRSHPAGGGCNVAMEDVTGRRDGQAISAGSPADGWTEQRIALLEQRVREGVSFSVIASELRISRNAAIGKAMRLGLAGASRPPAKRAARPPREPKNYTAIRKPARGNHGGIAFKLAAGTVGGKTKAGPIAIPPRPRTDLPKPESLGVTLLDIRFDQCRYPDGGVMDPAITYCGQPAWVRVVRGERRIGPWCEYHARLCYQPVGERANRTLARSANL